MGRVSPLRGEEASRLLPSSSPAPPLPSSSSSDLLAAHEDSAGVAGHALAPPRDRYRLVLAVFLLMGVGMLFPWNVFITADQFWRTKLEGSPFAGNFQSYFSIAYNIANIVGLLLLLRWAERLRIGLRILVALAVTTAVFVVITALVPVDAIAPEGFFGLAMACILVSGLATGLFQNGMFALSSHFPQGYTGAVMTGQGIAGTVVSLAQILTLLADGGDDDGELSALLYFIVAVVLLALCIVGYLFLQRLPFFRYYYVYPGGASAGGTAGAGSRTGPAGALGDSPSASKDLLPTLSEEEADRFDPLGQPTYWEVLLQIWPTGFGVLYIFVVTLSLFPTFIAAVDPLTEGSASRLFEKGFFVSFAFLLFNVSDLAGRWMAEWRLLIAERWLWLASLLRTVFFPLILLANVQLQGVETDLPLIIPNDALYFVVVLLFGFTNGYVASSCMIAAPLKLAPELREKAGVVMINCLVWGLFLGSMLSFGLRAILCRCNPFAG